MKSFILSAFYTTAAATVLGMTVVMSVDAAAYTLAAQTSIGASTPVDGITVGIIVGGVVAGFAGLITAARYMIRLGGMLMQWRISLDKAVQLAQIVERLERRMEESDGRVGVAEDRIEMLEATTVKDVRGLQEWRALIVDPSLIRSGATLRQDILDEAAG